MPQLVHREVRGQLAGVTSFLSATWVLGIIGGLNPGREKSSLF